MQRSFKKIASTLAIVLISIPVFAAKPRNGFAIVVDSSSYIEAREQIDNYAREIENDGLKVYRVIDKTGQPDSLRRILHGLYAQSERPIEGAVLIGDIPVVMVRDAQHMTSAFKMDQLFYECWESSVPSDRFYDDFSLSFEPLGQDSIHPGCFYYSLTAESVQQTRPNIYSGRIRPTDCDGTSRYEKLRHYLEKVVDAKRNPEKVDQILFFSGNGFISESMLARIDEKATLLEHFPWLGKQQNGIGYIDHKRDVHVKPRLMNEMQRRDLDFAVLHHHGDWDTEYLNNIPLTSDPTEQVEALKLYMRESMRHALQQGIPADSVHARMARRFNFPEEWFEGSEDSASIVKDSLFLRELDLYISDFDKYKPECRFVSLDACFNGSFHRDSSIANSYIFSPGRTIAVLANSVNVLQDKWVDRYVGLVGLGMNVGNIIKYAPYLEQNLIGDPTFTFASADEHVNVNEILRSDKISQWRRILTDKRYPTLQALAVEQLFRRGMLSSGELLDIFRSSDSYQMRMQTLINLSECRDDNFIEAVLLGLSDSYEMVQRFAANMIAKSGDERLIPGIIDVCVRNNTSERIEFSIKMGISMFEESKMLDELDRQFPKTNYIDSDNIKDLIRHSISYNANRWIASMQSIMDPDSSEKNRMQNIRMMRNYQVHFMVPQLLEYMCTSEDPQVQIAMLEAFGWFTLSVRRDDILHTVLDMSSDESLDDKVRDEALRTYNRLQ